MITVRPMNDNDAKPLQDLHAANSEFPFPDLNSPLCLGIAVAEIDGKVVGFGFIRLTSEVALIVDKSLPRSERANVIQELYELGRQEAQEVGLDEWHAFVYPELYAKFLEKRFGFVRCHGVAMTEVFNGKKGT